jgi:cytochrome c-type biogenesis protein CcmH
MILYLLCLLLGLVAAIILLWPRRNMVLSKSLLTATVTLMLAAVASYALSGRPSLPAKPAMLLPVPAKHTPDISTARAALLENPGNILAWVQMADALRKSGDTDAALEAMEVASRAIPDSADLWVTRGQLLVEKSGGEITPAARLAFDRAAALDPMHPAPRYMVALAWVMQGKPHEAKPVLEKLLRDTPPDTSYRAQIEKLLRGVNAMTAAGVGATGTEK